jgi:hypothetical protein
MTKLHQIFRKMHDPRLNRRRKHKLPDIIILSILAVLCGAESWDSIEMYGKMHIDIPISLNGCSWSGQIRSREVRCRILQKRS